MSGRGFTINFVKFTRAERYPTTNYACFFPEYDDVQPNSYAHMLGRSMPAGKIQTIIFELVEHRTSSFIVLPLTRNC